MNAKKIKTMKQPMNVPKFLQSRSHFPNVAVLYKESFIFWICSFVGILPGGILPGGPGAFRTTLEDALPVMFLGTFGKHPQFPNDGN